MGTNRLEAFSDGVIAIIITIMVLELHVPHGHAFEDLVPLVGVFLSYVLSFTYVGIYPGTTITICYTPATDQRVEVCGRTCISCSGCR